MYDTSIHGVRTGDLNHLTKPSEHNFFLTKPRQQVLPKRHKTPIRKDMTNKPTVPDLQDTTNMNKLCVARATKQRLV